MKIILKKIDDSEWDNDYYLLNKEFNKIISISSWKSYNTLKRMINSQIVSSFKIITKEEYKSQWEE